jgi:hypothetical protein
VYVDESESTKPQTVRVLLDEGKGQLRYPEMVRLFTDEEKRESRARAAFADPGPYESPLVRAFAFPMRPASAKKWDTLLALSFPLPVGHTGRDFTLGAAIARGARSLSKYEGKFHVDAPAAGGDTRHVTVFGDAALEGGQYRLTTVLSDPAGQQVVSAESEFVVPTMIDDILVLRGPAFARVVPGAKIFDTRKPDEDRRSRIEEILGADAGFEPLVINEIEGREALLSYWSVCVHGKAPIAPGTVVHRRFIEAGGATARELEPLPLALEDRGKGIACQEELEKLEPSTLASGEYRYEIVFTSAAGETISRSEAPLSVR